MSPERAATEKHLGMKDHENRAAEDASDESESATVAPSVTGIEEASTHMPQAHDQDKLEGESVPGSTTATAPAVSSGMPTPPNGGFTAWLQVLGGFFVYFNTWSVADWFRFSAI